MKEDELMTVMKLRVLAEQAGAVKDYRRRMNLLAEAARLATGVAADCVTAMQSAAADAIDAEREAQKAGA